MREQKGQIKKESARAWSQLETTVFDEIWRDRFSQFGQLNEQLSTKQRARIIRKTISRVLFDAEENEISLELLPNSDFELNDLLGDAVHVDI